MSANQILDATKATVEQFCEAEKEKGNDISQMLTLKTMINDYISPSSPNPPEESKSKIPIVNVYEDELDSDGDEIVFFTQESGEKLEIVDTSDCEGMIDSINGYEKGELFSYPCITFYENSEFVSGGFLNKTVFEEGKINILSAPMGSGKTYALSSFVTSLSSEKLVNPKVLIICPRISLVNTMAEKFGYISYSDNNNYKHANWIPCSFVTTMNSAHYLIPHIKNYDCLIIEEIASNIDSLISSITSMKMKDGFCQLVNLFISFMHKDKEQKRTLIFTDAIITKRELNFILFDRKIKDGAVNLKKYIPRSEEVKKKKRAVIYDSSTAWIRDLFTCCQTGNVVCGFSSKSYMEDLAKCIAFQSDELLTKIGLLESSDLYSLEKVICTLSSKSDPVERNEFLCDPDGFMGRGKRCVFHTSVVSSGVSVTKECHVFFQVGHNLSPVDIIQMIGRCRKPLSINILVEGSAKIDTFLSEDAIYEFFSKGLKGNTPEADSILKMLSFKKKNLGDIRSKTMSDRLKRVFTETVLAKYNLCKNTAEEVKKYLRVDSPYWFFKILVSPKKIPVFKEDLNKWASRLQHTAAGNYSSYKEISGLTAYHEEINRKTEEYELVNNINSLPFTVEKSFLLDGISRLRHDHLIRYMQTFGFGSWVHYFYYNLYPDSESEENSVYSGMNLYKCSYELLNILCMGSPEGMFSTNSETGTRVIFLKDFKDVERVFMIDYYKVVSFYELFYEWACKWKIFLISHLKSTVFENMIKGTSRSITVMTNLLNNFLNYLGIFSIKNHERLEKNNDPKRKTPGIAKKRLSSVLSTSKEKYGHAFREEFCFKPGEGESDFIRCTRFAPEIQLLKVYHETSHRYFWKMIRSSSLYAHPLAKSLGVIPKENYIPLENVRKLLKVMHSECKYATMIPSFWFNAVQDTSKKCETIFFKCLIKSEKCFRFCRQEEMVAAYKLILLPPENRDSRMEESVKASRNPFTPYLHVERTTVLGKRVETSLSKDLFSGGGTPPNSPENIDQENQYFEGDDEELIDNLGHVTVPRKIRKALELKLQRKTFD